MPCGSEYQWEVFKFVWFKAEELLGWSEPEINKWFYGGNIPKFPHDVIVYQCGYNVSPYVMYKRDYGGAVVVAYLNYLVKK